MTGRFESQKKIEVVGGIVTTVAARRAGLIEHHETGLLDASIPSSRYL